MAQKLAAFPEGANAREGYSRYPWNEWLDGGAWELSGPYMESYTGDDGKTKQRVVTFGDEDFTVTTKSFRSAAAQAARIRGGGIKTAVVKRNKITEDGEVAVENVIVQFVPRADTQHDSTAEDVTEDDMETADA